MVSMLFGWSPQLILAFEELQWLVNSVAGMSLKNTGYYSVRVNKNRCGVPTFGNSPPGQRDVGEVRVERRGLLPLAFLPQMEGLREPAHRPQRVVRTVVQLCKKTVQCTVSYSCQLTPRRIKNFLGGQATPITDCTLLQTPGLLI